VAFFFFSGLGIVKDIYGNTKLILDLINVDTVSNYIIVGSAFNSNSNKIEVFHSSSSQRNPIFWKQVKDEI
jgi:glycerone phosphate O-acyltransferase/fatty acyl-CoA reductase